MSAVGRPRGTDAHLMPEDWKLAVKAAMVARGIQQKELARAVGMTAGGLSRMLTPLSQNGMRASSKAVVVGDYVGVPLPSRPADIDEAAALDALRELRTLSPPAHSDLLAELFELRDRLRRTIRRKPRHGRGTPGNDNQQKK
jgi:transcriptional regulator with XRE-family HTH domain